MSGHILQMTNSIVKSETLASKADVDNGLSEQFAESSNVDLVESENLKNHALELEYAGAKEVSMSHVDTGKEKYYQVKASKEQGEADALGLEAAADEKLYEEEMEKSLSESAARLPEPNPMRFLLQRKCVKLSHFLILCVISLALLLPLDWNLMRQSWRRRVHLMQLEQLQQSLRKMNY